jgi:hypothetical protein
MRRSILISAALFFALTTPAFATKAGEDTHAPKGVKAGSHEDWCVEHNVAESQCTRCDKALIPVFKATGDWCQKHGLPNSQCVKCNPKLKIVRPAKGSK